MPKSSLAAQFLIAILLLAGCAVSAPPDADGAAGIRREPCGGGPVFPPEETVAQPSDTADAPAPQEKEPG